MTSAVTKEAAWLATATVDGLPNLPSTFDVVQAYWPRTPTYRKAGLYLTRPGFQDMRFGAHRKIRRHQFLLRAMWPIGGGTVGTPLWETEQATFDAAVGFVIQRIVAFDMDKTHGGRFLSVAEAPDAMPISVTFSDPARASGGGGRVELSADITYYADDTDYIA